MSGFNANDKVVCINDKRESVFGRSADDFLFPNGYLVKGTIYCVEQAFDAERGTQGLILSGPKVHLRAGGRETGFNSTRFRRVHPRGITTTTETTLSKERTSHEPS